jgi:hypothetical protein
LVERGDEHVAFGFANDHLVVLEEQEEVQGGQVVLVVAIEEFEGVQNDEVWHAHKGLLLELHIPEEERLLAQDLREELEGRVRDNLLGVD